MELTLTTRQVILTNVTMELQGGEQVVYYGNDYSLYVHGIVHKRNNEFYIEWEDITDILKLDMSKHCKSVLKYCAFL